MNDKFCTFELVHPMTNIMTTKSKSLLVLIIGDIQLSYTNYLNCQNGNFYINYRPEITMIKKKRMNRKFITIRGLPFGLFKNFIFFYSFFTCCLTLHTIPQRLYKIQTLFEIISLVIAPPQNLTQ